MKLIKKYIDQIIFYCKIGLCLLKYSINYTGKETFFYDPYGNIYKVGSFSLKKVDYVDLSQYNIRSVHTCSNNEKPFSDLMEMINTARKDGTSQAGCRVNIKKNIFKSTVTKNEEGIYCGNVQLDYSILDKNDNKLLTYKLDMDNYSHPTLDITETYIETLILLAFSGIYATPEDFNTIFDIMSEKRQDPTYLPYLCDECNEGFKTYQELIQHLDNTGHYDRFFEQYPYYEPLTKIREKYNHNLKNNIQGEK